MSLKNILFKKIYIQIHAANEFLLHTVETIGKLKKKNAQVQIMSFYSINVETIGKCINIRKINL